MSDIIPETSHRPGPASSRNRRFPASAGRWLVNVIVSLAIVAVSIAGAAYIKNAAPKAKKHTPVQFVPLVEIVSLEPADHHVSISAMGTVIPSREVDLRARVGGQVFRVHPEFVDGGVVAKDAVLIALEDEDYRLAVAQKESGVVDAQYRLQLEMGHQDVARREWEILNDGKPPAQEDVSLALRKPHLAKARADLTAAQAQLAKARLDLERTVIRAPFNGIVLNKRVDVGAQVSPQDTLAGLVGTDAFWVETHVRVDHLQWIDIPGNQQKAGAAARVRYRNGFHREGTVIRLLKDLETEGRMARLIVAVKNPLAPTGDTGGLPPMLIGEYVHVDIDGRALAGVYRIPRLALRDNEFVWILNEDETLDIRRVTPIWRGPDAVLVRDNIAPGDRLIVSTLANPAKGMRLTSRPAAAPRPEENPTHAS